MDASIDLVMGVHVKSRSFRVLLHGNKPDIQAVVESWSERRSTVDSEDEALQIISQLCEVHQVLIADILDMVGPSHEQTLAQQMMFAAHAKDAESAFVVVDGILAGASDESITNLIQSDDLVWVRAFILGVIENLDENSDSARKQLATYLSGPAKYLLLTE